MYFTHGFQSFPLPIPNTVTVPSWAYLDVNVNHLEASSFIVLTFPYQTTGVWDEAASFTVHNSGEKAA